MHDVVRMPPAKLKELFALTAKQMSMSPGIVEKDFWVVWTLDYLFARSPWRTQLAFKGGTSLSKAYGLIKRFSEDIDLILDWRLLGYGLREPWETRSNTQQDLFNEAANARSAAFLKDVFVPRVKTDLESESGRTLDIGMDALDPNTVVFRYPCVFGESSILREIRIESGALAAWTLFAALLRPLVPLPVRCEGAGARRHPASRCRRRLQAQVLPLQLGALRTGNGGGYLAHAARTCAVGTGVRLSAYAEYDFRSAPAILRNRGYGSRPRGGKSRERRFRELIWRFINASIGLSARRT